MLIAGRIIQGLGAGVGVLAVAISAEHLTPGDVPKALAVIIGAASFGGVTGLLTTGLLVDHVSATAIFWVVGGCAAATAVAAWRVVEETTIYTRERVDLLGAALLGGTLGTVMLAVSKSNEWGWSSQRIVGLLLGATALPVAWVAWERWTANPPIDLRPMTRRPIWSVNVVSFAVGFGFFAPLTLVALLAGYPTSTGYGLGLGGTSIALLLLPNAAAVLVGAFAGGRLISRIGPRAEVFAAVGLATLSTTALVVLPSTAVALAASLVPLGIGIGLGVSALLNAVVLGSSKEEVGITTGLAVTARTVGQALGPQVAIAVAVAVSSLAPGVLAEGGFENAFGFMLLASLAVTLAACLIPGRRANIRPGQPASQDVTSQQGAPSLR